MIRALIYASLICWIMTIGLVAVDIYTHQDKPFISATKDLSKVKPDSKHTSNLNKHSETVTKISERQQKTHQINNNLENINLTILVKGINSTRGEIIALLYDNQNTFNNTNGKAINSISIPVKHFTGELHFNNLPPKEYALKLFHDENSNQQFDQSDSFIEGYAYSNNIGKNIQAKFHQAAFHADNNKQLIINLIYH